MLASVLSDLQDRFGGLLGWMFAGGFVLLGLVLYGWRDLIRLSFTRIWAIGGVSYRDALRRRVLWIAPLAMLGVAIVSQLLNPLDEQDAVRQTLKFAMFATGLVVVLATIILAATSLPKEIENKVIYTIVTKPTTRLEIVLGKIVGFARVSATILLIMGAFTWAYLHLRAWQLQRLIDERIAAVSEDDPIRASLAFYQDEGLLRAREYARPAEIAVLADLPNRDVPVRWISGPARQNAIVPFSVDLSLLPATEQDVATALPMIVRLRMAFRPSRGEADAMVADLEEEQPIVIPFLPGQDPRSGSPEAYVSVLQADRYNLVGPASVNNGQPVRFYSDHRTVGAEVKKEALPAIVARSVDGQTVQFYIMVAPVSDRSYDYAVSPESVHLIFPKPDGTFFEVAPSGPAVFRAWSGSVGDELAGGKPGVAPLALYSYPDARPRPGQNLLVEFRTKIEKDVADTEQNVPTEVSFQLRDRSTGELSPAVSVFPENNRPAFARIPAASVPAGGFDLVVRNTTANHWVTLRPGSIGLAVGTQGFLGNLLKGLLVLWLLSILVIVIAFFCSTFLSWPIAVVLTLVILLGHWGVNQLSDSLTPGIGRSIANEMGMRDAAASRVVSTSVEAMSQLLRTISAVLPDISRFAAVDDLERGVSIPWSRVGDAAEVLLLFGVVLAVAAYLILDNKEVAP